MYQYRINKSSGFTYDSFIGIMNRYDVILECPTEIAKHREGYYSSTYVRIKSSNDGFRKEMEKCMYIVNLDAEFPMEHKYLTPINSNVTYEMLIQ